MQYHNVIPLTAARKLSIPSEAELLAFFDEFAFTEADEIELRTDFQTCLESNRMVAD